MSVKLFEPFQLGDLTLANRMVMAPLTRNRADRNGLATPMMATFYAQRASAGLIIAEAAPVSPGGIGACFTPGIFSEDQANSWRKVTDAVHSAGGHIFAQLQYCGRISHPSLLPGNATPVAPSAIRPPGQAFTCEGLQDFVQPRALEIREITDIVSQFRQGAEMARRAGFDGVEVLAANGFLIDQFLRDSTNHRTDAYGGDMQKRMRLLHEVIDSVCTCWPVERVGVRLSPENRYNAMSDSDPGKHFHYFVGQLNARRLAYLHVLEGDMSTRIRELDYHALRALFPGTYLANNGYDFEQAQAALNRGTADLVAFGIPFLANPDLVRRYQEGLPLNQADPSSYFGGDESGYIDYPFYAEEM
ncbi:alkene reductase [Thiolapillus brandeum]|uniref:N-ethylmaleimide reductase n=1 Tax=Thiolapillus brandeum TaxID=1076588 RepID=A0A7U6JJ00_9GAMM|nr:alkene reductase [Thiolapillus brandeum]BAO45337.1 N-ethylmaleimide reductase [Thiolapillus brandeum]